MHRGSTILLVLLCPLFSLIARSQNQPDQAYILRGDSLVERVESSDGLVSGSDGRSLQLGEDRTDGYAILMPQYAQYPFNEGLPSWNGTAPDSGSSFMIQMRFPYGSGWSPWLTVGYWKAEIWPAYGATSYSDGYIDIDNVKLSSFAGAWQFKITMTRDRIDQPSPTLTKLSFFVSDSRSTSSVNIDDIVTDAPPEVFVPTDFIYQYGVDPEIGGDICSPTSVSMILRSYGIPVDPLHFARDTYDTHFDMFGIWPRVVQNASEYGLDGAVTRYRSWSQARQVLASGGRIAMSVGPPLYSGHLMMLAGFTSAGNPIVHDPARSNGYAYVYNKTDLSHSWFDKGGVAYTFFNAGAGPDFVVGRRGGEMLPSGLRLFQNYPNPFNPRTEIRYQVSEVSNIELKVFDILGRVVATLSDGKSGPGRHAVEFDGTGLPSGVYVARLTAGSLFQSRKMILLR